MRMINPVADRLLSIVLPHAEAGACDPDHGEKFWVYCYCRNRRVHHQRCTVTCSGGQTCAVCVQTGEPC
ncbi:hypothetical protein [Phytomonospora endophytica]|uniref:Glucose dehydrogenase n=1 Tax=Phytomonospora endophytica TaxID=714109 RepID=A0A841FN85_9ACTN|nr:hypothetical protein [Phytomonospora endophytica]MBB6037495.1 glucose dehydrogenase [Phytomonospora endophytica]GIG70746.1 hypothetical protein Pen01_70410 [Phytomonospora endophytica]